MLRNKMLRRALIRMTSTNQAALNYYLIQYSLNLFVIDK